MTNANKSWVLTSRNFLARQRLRVADCVSIDLYVAALVILTCRRLRTNYWNNLNYYPPRPMTYQIIRRAQSPLSFYTLLYLELILMRAWEVREDSCLYGERNRVCVSGKINVYWSQVLACFIANLQHLKFSDLPLLVLLSFLFYAPLTTDCAIILLLRVLLTRSLSIPLKHNFYLFF